MTVNTATPYGLTLRQTITSGTSVSIPAGVNWVYAIVVGRGGNGNSGYAGCFWMPGGGGGGGGVTVGWALAKTSVPCRVSTNTTTPQFSFFSNLYAGNGGGTGTPGAGIGGAGGGWANGWGGTGVGSSPYYGQSYAPHWTNPQQSIRDAYSAGGSQASQFPAGSGMSGGGGAADANPTSYGNGGNGWAAGGGGSRSSSAGVGGSSPWGFTGGAAASYGGGGGAGLLGNGGNASTNQGGAGGTGGGGGGGSFNGNVGQGGQGCILLYY